MKKISANTENVNEVMNEAQPKARKPRRSRKAEKEAAAPAAMPADKASKPQAPKKPKMVEIVCKPSFLAYATAKAYLFKLIKEDGQEESCWLAKSQMEISNADADGNITCKCAAWLYYRSGLKKILPITRMA